MTETVANAIARKDGQRNSYTPDKTEGGILALRPEQDWWTARQAAALKSLGIKRATDEDLLVFLNYCQRTGLDPFSKQIYLLERKSKNRDTGSWEYTQTIQVGIDGLRVNAQRAADRRGMAIEYEQTIWYDQDGGRHEVWLDSEPPAAALVTVVKVLPDGRRLRVPGLAKFESYAAYGTNKDKTERWLQNQWATMPDHMIEKCAEAFALRRCFPQDLSGLYIEEELQNAPPPELPARQREPFSDDDDVVKGTVEHPADGPETNGDAPEDPPAGGSTPPTVKESQARIAAAFKDKALDAKAFAKLRLAIVTGLLTPDQEAITDYIDVKSMTPEAMAVAADTVVSYCENLTDIYAEDGTPVMGTTQQLREYGEQVIDAITAAKVSG